METNVVHVCIFRHLKPQSTFACMSPGAARIFQRDSAGDQNGTYRDKNSLGLIVVANCHMPGAKDGYRSPGCLDGGPPGLKSNPIFSSLTGNPAEVSERLEAGKE